MKYNYRNVRTLKCPHCLKEIHLDLYGLNFLTERDDWWTVEWGQCPGCKNVICWLLCLEPPIPGEEGQVIKFSRMINPIGGTRNPVPAEVPVDIAADYTEAGIILPFSPKASAALSRRCLQLLLRTAAGVKPGDLSNEIQEVLDSLQLPSHLAESIDAVRNIGNFGAHPNKSKSTGDILPVEPHEAEWNLDVLEGLFDFYYVQPEKSRIRRDALNKKLTDAGKNPMK